ncbi:unnamed protein product [Nezara viridula]|uniref:Uncharacterized protein n=1 Tax=Nezara viridula TaxID=85310 RepID=A0A9P0MUN2_NEZVI|nr:unnamed protein product [Nezara viridula]
MFKSYLPGSALVSSHCFAIFMNIISRCQDADATPVRGHMSPHTFREECITLEYPTLDCCINFSEAIQDNTAYQLPAQWRTRRTAKRSTLAMNGMSSPDPVLVAAFPEPLKAAILRSQLHPQVRNKTGFILSPRVKPAIIGLEIFEVLAEERDRECVRERGAERGGGIILKGEVAVECGGGEKAATVLHTNRPLKATPTTLLLLSVGIASIYKKHPKPRRRPHSGRINHQTSSIKNQLPEKAGVGWDLTDGPRSTCFHFTLHNLHGTLSSIINPFPNFTVSDRTRINFLLLDSRSMNWIRMAENKRQVVHEVSKDKKKRRELAMRGRRGGNGGAGTGLEAGATLECTRFRAENEAASRGNPLPVPEKVGGDS